MRENYAQKEEAMTTTPQRFTKRPVTIEAIQLTQANADDVAAWCGCRIEYTYRVAFKIPTRYKLS